MKVGVLALHGDFAEHIDVLSSMGIEAFEIRTLLDFHGVTHLIIPGGESTVMSLLLQKTALDTEIRSRVHEGDLAVYGTCAGAILVAAEVTGKNAPATLGLMDITVERNAYGTQAQSFETELSVKGLQEHIHASFIRAPKITRVGPEVEVLASVGNDPVLVREGKVLAGTFHPEVRGEKSIHELFLSW